MSATELSEVSLCARNDWNVFVADFICLKKTFWMQQRRWNEEI